MDRETHVEDSGLSTQEALGLNRASPRTRVAERSRSPQRTAGGNTRFTAVWPPIRMCIGQRDSGSAEVDGGAAKEGCRKSKPAFVAWEGAQGRLCRQRKTSERCIPPVKALTLSGVVSSRSDSWL